MNQTIYMVEGYSSYGVLVFRRFGATKRDANRIANSRSVREGFASTINIRKLEKWEHPLVNKNEIERL